MRTKKDSVRDLRKALVKLVSTHKKVLNKNSKK